MVHTGQLTSIAARLFDGQHPPAVIRVRADPFPLGPVQWPSLDPDPVGNSDAAEVVDLGGPADVGPLRAGHARASATAPASSATRAE